jgi:hypothetical protein
MEVHPFGNISNISFSGACAYSITLLQYLKKGFTNFSVVPGFGSTPYSQFSPGKLALFPF